MNEQEIYIAAMCRDDLHDRNRFLDDACGDDPELRERINSLLKHGQQANRFMEDLPLEVLALDEIDGQHNLVGTTIGPYKLCELVGEGGMGEVYVAEQESPLRRTVALKIVKPGMDSKEVMARFEAERQTLALMEHPHIARVIEGGTTEAGRPYFVMELVHGIPITKFCDQYKFSIERRLRLFIDVCQAIQHAHHKGRSTTNSRCLDSTCTVAILPKHVEIWK